MELLAAICLLAILTLQAIESVAIVRIEKWLSIISSIEPEEPTAAKVTDPYTRPREVYESTRSIVVPKTPQEIRNQNFQRLKEGVEYGDFNKR